MSVIESVQRDEIINPETLEFYRAIKTPEEGYKVCEALRDDNKQRNITNAEISKKLRDAQPYDQRVLNEANQRWRSNRSTGFMSSLVARMLPPYKQMLDSAKYLTGSRLSGDSVEESQKSEFFQREITRLLRQWDGFDDFNNRLLHENIVFGCASAGYTDEFEWRPKFFRTDDAFFPDGNPQLAKDTPAWVLQESWLIHEAARKLQNPDIAEEAGWNIDNLVEAINLASPDNRSTGQAENVRKWQDLIREKSLGTTYSSGVRVIKVYHLFAQEANGTVSHYIYSQENKKELFGRHDRYEDMLKCLALFTVETGDGKLHGSKGAGRRLYNTHVAVEQSRNLASDNFYIAGLTMLQTTDKAAPDVALTVMHPCVVVPEGFQVISQKYPVDVQSFVTLDRFNSMQAEVQVMAFLPSSDLNLQSGKSKPTASQINYIASVEQQIRQGVLMRFWNQYLRMIDTLQKRVCSIDNIREAARIVKLEGNGPFKRMTAKLFEFLKGLGQTLTGQKPEDDSPIGDRDAVNCVLRMMRKGLSVQDIFELVNSPAYQAAQEVAQEQSAAWDAVTAKYTGSPHVKQAEMAKRDVASKLGNGIAEEICIDDGDPTSLQENIRMQLLELTSLLDGEPVPISPRDDDLIHGQTIQQKVSDIFDKISDLRDTQAFATAQNVLTHLDAHIASATTKGLDKMQVNALSDFSAKAKTMIEQAVTSMKSGQALPPPTQGGAPNIIPALPVPKGAHNGPQHIDETQAANLQQSISPKPIPPGQAMPLAHGKIPIQPMIGR